MKGPCVWAYTVINCSEILHLKLTVVHIVNMDILPELYGTLKCSLHKNPMTGSCLMADAFSPHLNLLFQKTF